MILPRPCPHLDCNDITLEQRTDQTSVKKFGLSRIHGVFGKKSKIVKQNAQVCWNKLFEKKIIIFIVITCKKKP